MLEFYLYRFQYKVCILRQGMLRRGLKLFKFYASCMNLNRWLNKSIEDRGMRITTQFDQNPFNSYRLNNKHLNVNQWGHSIGMLFKFYYTQLILISMPTTSSLDRRNIISINIFLISQNSFSSDNITFIFNYVITTLKKSHACKLYKGGFEV